MIDWIKGLFGRGRIRIEFEGVDRNGKVVTGDAKMPYVGSYDKESALSEFKNQIMYKDGIVITKATIVAHIEG
jgi:hypothetical protein